MTTTFKLPEIGISLPPGVQGCVQGEVLLTLNWCVWHKESFFDKICGVNIKWWGDSSKKIYFGIPTSNVDNSDFKQSRGKLIRLPLSVRFPVQCSQQTICKYFKDMGALQLDVYAADPHDAQDCVYVGETFVVLNNVTGIKPLPIGWHSVHTSNGEKVATLKLGLTLNFFLKVPQTSLPKLQLTASPQSKQPKRRNVKTQPIRQTKSTDKKEESTSNVVKKPEVDGKLPPAAVDLIDEILKNCMKLDQEMAGFINGNASLLDTNFSIDSLDALKIERANLLPPQPSASITLSVSDVESHFSDESSLSDYERILELEEEPVKQEKDVQTVQHNSEKDVNTDLSFIVEQLNKPDVVKPPDKSVQESPKQESKEVDEQKESRVDENKEQVEKKAPAEKEQENQDSKKKEVDAPPVLQKLREAKQALKEHCKEIIKTTLAANNSIQSDFSQTSVDEESESDRKIFLEVKKMFFIINISRPYQCTNRMRVTCKYLPLNIDEPMEFTKEKHFVYSVLDVRINDNILREMRRFPLIIEAKEIQEDREIFLGVGQIKLNTENVTFIPQDSEPFKLFEDEVIVRNPISNSTIEILNVQILLEASKRAVNEAAEHVNIAPLEIEDQKIQHDEEQPAQETSHQSPKESNQLYSIENVQIEKETESDSSSDEERIPSGLPLAHTSRLTVAILKASGLKEAVINSKLSKEIKEHAAQVGPNSFVKYKLNLSRDEEYKSTPIIANSFCPNWDYEKDFEIQINEDVYSRLEDGDAIFEVYHKNLSENVREESEKAVLLGTCAIPLRDVLFEKQGITGWFNIYNDEKVVGSINLEIVLDEYSRRDLLRKSKDSFEYSPRTELDENPSLYKFTITVEEAFIPYEALLNITPHYIRAKRHSFVCQYFVSYRFYGAGRVDSRLYSVSNSTKRVQLRFTKEFKVINNYGFMDFLKSGQIPISLYVSIARHNQEEESVRQLAQTLGTAYLKLSPLYQKKIQSKSKMVWISGSYTLVNEKAPSMENGKLNVRVVWEEITSQKKETDDEHNLSLDEELIQKELDDEEILGTQLETILGSMPS